MLKMAPSFIKIDGSLIKILTVIKMPIRRSQAIIAFSEEINAEVIAGSLLKMKRLPQLPKACGVHLMQGYYFSMPSTNL